MSEPRNGVSSREKSALPGPCGTRTRQLLVQEVPVQGYLSLLLAMSVATAGLLPFAVAGVIQIGMVD